MEEGEGVVDLVVSEKEFCWHFELHLSAKKDFFPQSI